MASIKDVAKHAGVAISTVSKVLNQYPGVSEATKEKVNRAIAELNFVPNAVAAALSSKQSNRIALLIRLHTNTQAIDEISMRYLAGALHEALDRKMDVVTIFFSMLEGKTIDEVENYLRSQSINGLIIYGMGRTDAILNELVERQNFKTVIVDASLVNKNTTCVWVDQEKAQYEVAVKTFQSSSSIKNVLYISGTDGAFVIEERMKGIQKFCEDYHLNLTTKNGQFSEKKALEIATLYGKDNDMIICASDLMAIGASNALKVQGISRPICGFDGITLMGYAGVGINTVFQDFSDISRVAVTEIAHLLSGGEGHMVYADYEIKTLAYEDIIR